MPLILVLGGTGTQGGNVARELLKHGHRVRVLSRDPDSMAARQVKELGAEVRQGDLANPDSLASVMEGVDAMFSVQYADPFDMSVEPRNAFNMAEAAKKAGIKQVVHTSVAGSDIFPRWNKSAMLTMYWEHKYYIEELVRKGGFTHWTILHPSYFMENFLEPLATYMAPELKNGKLVGALYPETPLKLNCGQDTATFARAAFENPEQFSGSDINIASDELSMAQIAATLSEALDKKIVYEQVNTEDGIKRGLLEGTLESHQWMNEVRGWGFDLNETKAFNLPTKSFVQWLQENKNKIVVQ